MRAAVATGPASAQATPEAAVGSAHPRTEASITPGRHRQGRRGRHLHPRRRRSAGRDLRAAIPVGLGLVLVLGAVLLLVPSMFPVLVALALMLCALEVIRALEHADMHVPELPMLIGVVGMVVSTAVFGSTGLLAATAVIICAVILWRIAESLGMPALRDICASVFTLAWVPLLGSFAVLLQQQDRGIILVLLAVLVPVGNDTGGYIAGVLFGRHPMAPRISPKKSWEGLVGSLIGGVAVAVAITALLLGLPWWIGAVIGVVLVVVSTCGDLAQSLLKRDLGIKDMGDILPGHGGMLDRLDSVLLAAPTTYILLEVLA